MMITPSSLVERLIQILPAKHSTFLTHRLNALYFNLATKGGRFRNFNVDRHFCRYLGEEAWGTNINSLIQFCPVIYRVNEAI